MELADADLVLTSDTPVKLSERGLAMVRHILDLPLPRQVWLMPRSTADTAWQSWVKS
jgi:hypothetical protein